MHITFISSKLK